MTYVLRATVLDDVPDIEISAEYFAALRTACEILVVAFAIEEKYEIVVSNFIAVEKKILEIPVSNRCH